MKKHLPLLVALGAVILVGSRIRGPGDDQPFHLQEFGRLPTLVNGRIKPLDTVARTALLFLQNKQRFQAPDGKRLAPGQWLLDVLYRPDVADDYRHFRIDNTEALSLFGLTEEDTKIHYAGRLRQTLAALGFLPSTTFLFSFNQLKPGLEELQRQADAADQVEAAARTPFQREVIRLRDRATLYHRLKHSLQLPESTDFAGELAEFAAAMPDGLAATRARLAGQPHDENRVRALAAFVNQFEFLSNVGYLLPIPPIGQGQQVTEWTTVGRALLGSLATGEIPPQVRAYAELGRAYRSGDTVAFNAGLATLRESFAARFGDKLAKSALEYRFNYAEPFYQAMMLYVAAFLLAVVSWLKWPDLLGRTAFYLAVVAFGLTTAGIITRMYLEGRPPVTNLYSSALFVGWVASALGLVLERIFRNSVGNVVAGALGFLTLIIAHHLSFQGDTLEMMRAVLDSNFWLATHVVVIAMGYGATFLAGFLAVIFILRGVLTRSLDRGTADALARMVYGIVCFATLFSLVGTILGGIWADQSWGRFWGWDPKENGALIIVLWNAIILHARWGGMVEQRGLMNLAVFGNVVTSWSWFGVNMLGVGLHSYGFMDSAFIWLVAFVVLQLAIIALGSLPLARWRSLRALPPAVTTAAR